MEFRRNHIGSPEQATRTLLYQKNQLQYLQGYPTYYPPGAAGQHQQPHAQGAPGGGGPPSAHHQSYAQFSPYAPVGSYPTPPGLITNAGHQVELISRIFLTKFHFCNFKYGQKSIFELGKSLKLPKLQFHEKILFVYLISRVFLPG